jgi:hypothetical protein
VALPQALEVGVNRQQEALEVVQAYLLVQAMGVVEGVLQTPAWEEEEGLDSLHHQTCYAPL